jgi:hypothetical protein
MNADEYKMIIGVYLRSSAARNDFFYSARFWRSELAALERALDSVGELRERP